jgi:hypothetical protein
VKSFPGCGHCGTIIHTGGKTQCPWKKFSKKKAKLKANAMLHAILDGAGVSSKGGVQLAALVICPENLKE